MGTIIKVGGKAGVGDKGAWPIGIFSGDDS